jgi:hypothetical protein
MSKIDNKLAEGIALGRNIAHSLSTRYARVRDLSNQIVELERNQTLSDKIETLELKIIAIQSIRNNKPQEGVNYDEELAFMEKELFNLRAERVPQQQELDL